MAKIITIANQKGGCGKTTTTLNLAHALAKKGKKVLAVDFDSQANLSMCCGVDDPDSDEIEFSIADLMYSEIEEEDFPEKDKYILHDGDIDFIPASISLSMIESKLQQGTISAEKTLSYILERVSDDYDYILIDTCPSLGILTINALTAADEVVITVNPQFLSMKGLNGLLKTIKKIKRRINPKLSINGILLTMCDTRTNLYKQVVSDITSACGDVLKVYETHIPSTVKIGEANYSAKSIVEYAPNTPASKAYMEFAEELTKEV